MIDTFYSLFCAPFVEFAFMRRALVGCLALSLSVAPVGILLVLRRMSLMGDAMSHAILPGAAIGFIVSGLSLPAMSLGGLAAGLCVAFLSGLVTRVTSLKEDASLAGFYLLSLAIGVLLISHFGTQVDLIHILFGSVLAVDKQALLFLGCTTSVTLITLAWIARPLLIESFDPDFLKAVGYSGTVFHLLFLGLVVLNLVAGFQALGSLMAVGLMMLPATTARLWSQRLGSLIGIAIAIAFSSSLSGLLLSYHFNQPSGPSIILSAGSFYLFSLLFGTQGGIFNHCLGQKHFKF